MIKFLMIMLFIFVTSVSANEIKDISFTEFDALELHAYKDYRKGINKSEELISLIEKKTNQGSKDVMLMAFVNSTKVFLEGRQAYKLDKVIDKKDWFLSNQFKQRYKLIELNVHKALRLAKIDNQISYRELSRVISNPFLSAEVKEIAQKHSLLVLKNADIGSDDHPLSRDQYVGRIYKVMMQDYCAEKKCSEIRRLSKELAGYSEENRKLSEELLRSYEGLIEKEDQTLTEVSRDKVDKKDILIKSDDTVGKSKLDTEPEAVNEQENINGADKLKSITSLKSVPVEKYVLGIVVFLLIVMMVFWVGRRRKM